MNRQEVYEKLNEVFRDIFDDDQILVTDETTAEDIDDWDSLQHISLINAIEEEFDITFNMKQVLLMKNVGEMVDLILELLD